MSIDPRPAMLAKLSKATLVTGARFIEKTDFDPICGCLLWTGKRASGKHGVFKMSSKPVPAHRASFQMFCSPGPLPKVVMKTCKATFCVHPGHLAADPRHGPRVDNLFTC